jgi:hypothetical protein
MAWWHRVVIESRWVVWRQILETSGATIFSTVSSVATLFITARLLGPDGRGVLAAATSWGLLFATLGSFSIGQVLVHRATGAEQSAWLPEAAGAMIAVIGGSVAIIWTAVAAVYFANPSALFNNMTGAQLLLAVLPVPLIMWNENGRYVLYSLGALRTANAGAILGAAVSLLAVLLFVAVLKWQIAGALLALVASSFATTVVTAREYRSSTGSRQDQLAGDQRGAPERRPIAPERDWHVPLHAGECRDFESLSSPRRGRLLSIGDPVLESVAGARLRGERGRVRDRVSQRPE